VLVDCVNRFRGQGLTIVDAIVAAGQQRLRPIISTTLSTIGGIITLTITDKLWEGLGVVIIFGIGFATVLTLMVVPVMYLIFESLGYRVISAVRGPRYKTAPEGRSFFYTRRRYARFWALVILTVQAGLLVFGAFFIIPHVRTLLATTEFQAPNLLKVVIEVIVFVLQIGLAGLGLLLVLMLPTWVGGLILMSRRTTESQYIDVTATGITLTSPVERLFLAAETIERVRYSKWLQRLTIWSGQRRIRIRKVVEAAKKPEKVPLTTWLMQPAPKRADIQAGTHGLHQAVEKLMVKEEP
jgi:hypothetical protein